MRWIESCLYCWAQRVVTSGTKCSWRPVTTGALRVSILGPIPLQLFISDLDEGRGCTLSRSAGGTKLGGVTDTSGSRAAIERDLDRLGNGQTAMS